MTQEKKFAIKCIGYANDMESELFEVIIGPLEEMDKEMWGDLASNISRNVHNNVYIRTRRPYNMMKDNNGVFPEDFFHISGHYIPPLIKGSIYLFSYVGKAISRGDGVVVGFEGGGLKEFRDITSGFSVRKFVKEEIERLQRKISSLENDVDYWKNRANNNSALVTKNSSKLVSLESDLKVVRIANIALQGQVEDKDKQIREKNELIKVGEKVLQTTQSQLTTTQNQVQQKENQIAVMENKLDQRRDELKAVEKSLNNLKIESGKKDSELKNREKEIKNLKKNLGTTQRDAFDEKLRFKEEKLENLATQLGIQLRRIQTLRRRFKELIIAQENNNNNSANIAQENIIAIKETLQGGGISIDNIQRICKKCRKISQLEWQLEQTRQQQQYEARQEVPPHNNN